uniref:F-actin monooxygenase n=1 Tax=Salarias fasciatus TaxID=181472 RepID=A0A672FJB2_SALFA
MGDVEDVRASQAVRLFETLVQASSCRGTLQAFSTLCRQLDLDPLDHHNFYGHLKDAVRSWKVQALWTKLDKRAQNKVYGQNGACSGTRVLVVGGGPCGLRTAIELRLLGCKVVLIEKRDTFSRNNVLHLWPFAIHDLRGLGAKHFYGKFCAGSIDHISIRQLQLMLLKVSLILGVEVHVNVEFVKLLEPSEEPDAPGWRALVLPSSHSVSEFEFDVVIGADGRRNTLEGFSRKEFRGKLAIAITANFVNRNSAAEASVEEISGVAFIFNQRFFLELRDETGIDLENIVYYKDQTHYFVMTAKKHSLLEKGVLLRDFPETERLLSPENVSQDALRSFARQAADFGTGYQLPALDFAVDQQGRPDVAVFDFTCMHAAESAALIRRRRGRRLLAALVGDSLLEPFWPMGTGCARGFLAAFDTAWMIRGWRAGRAELELLAERESLYRLLPQTTSENISKNFEQYSIDPATRYPNLNSCCVRPHQVSPRTTPPAGPPAGSWSLSSRVLVSLSSREDPAVRPGLLLAWCQRQTQGYRGVRVRDLSRSWRSGLALCALIHRQRPGLIDFDALTEDDPAGNVQLALDLAQREFGVQPVTTGAELTAGAEPDKLLMVFYLTRLYQAFRDPRDPPGDSKAHTRDPPGPGPSRPSAPGWSQIVSVSVSGSKEDENSDDVPSGTENRLGDTPPGVERGGAASCADCQSWGGAVHYGRSCALWAELCIMGGAVHYGRSCAAPSVSASTWPPGEIQGLVRSAVVQETTRAVTLVR